MLIPDLLRRSAERYPDKVAIRFPDAELTYRELDSRSDVVAASLRELGLGPGERVAIIHDNAPPAIVLFWGILRAGAVSVDVPRNAAAPVISEVLREAAPRAVAIDAKKWEELEAEGMAQGLAPTVLTEDWLDDVLSRSTSAPVGDVPGDPDDPALVIYTSGTTGRPKGVILSHRNMISNLLAANELMQLDETASILMVVPFFYVHGRMQLILHVLLGGTVVVSAGFQFPQTVLEELRESGVTGFSGVPYHFKQLLRRTTLSATPLPGLRYVLITGGAMSENDLRELADALGGVEIHLAYGQTEASPRITYMGPRDIFGEKRESAGIPLPGTTVEILDGEDRALPPGEVGEIVVSGPGVMVGYLSGDERSSGKIDAHGRLRTGDVGYLDDDGYLYLVGRSSDMIKTAGERIFPGEIEPILNRHDDIVESAVLGVPDDTLGERVVALVVMEGERTPELTGLRKHCLGFMPFVRAPREVHAVDALPKTASGKIDRSGLPPLVPSS